MSYIKGEAGIGKVFNGYDNDHKPIYNMKIVLPHSCDEWVIGGKEEAEELIKDLQELIKSL